MCSRSHRLTDENRKCSAAAEMTSPSKVPRKTGCGSPELARDAAASTVVGDSLNKAAGMVEHGDRPTSSRGVSTEVTARRGPQRHHCQQHFTEATELLKRAAEKQLTGSSLAERMLIKKLNTLPDIKTRGVQAAANDTVSDSSGSKISKDVTAVTKTSHGVPTNDTQAVVKSDADSARRTLSILHEAMSDVVDDITNESRSMSVADIDLEESPEPRTAAASKERTVQFQQQEFVSQDDSDLRTVSVNV